jgi:hypothetical protein
LADGAGRQDGVGLHSGLVRDADGQRFRDVDDGSCKGRVAGHRDDRRVCRSGRARRRRQNCARGVDRRLLLRRQRRVLSLRGGDLTQQIAPLGLQVGAHRRGLLGRSAGVGGRLLRGRGGGGRALTRCMKGLHPIGRLSDDDPLQGQLVDQLLRGACGQHRRGLTGASTRVRHRRYSVDRGLERLELRVRKLEGC